MEKWNDGEGKVEGMMNFGNVEDWKTKKKLAASETEEYHPKKLNPSEGEKKKRHRRRFSWQMNRDYNSMNDGEYPTALAAAVFAIKSFEESNIPAQGKTSEGQDTSLTKIKSKADGTASVSEPRTLSTKSLDEAPGKIVSSIRRTPSIKKTLTWADKNLNGKASTEVDSGVPDKAIGPASSTRKTTTFAEHLNNSTAKTEIETAVPKKEVEMQRQSSTKPGIGDTKADVWEKDEMEKIRKRYDKSSTALFNWENKKKAKARRKKETVEAELERRRAKALRNYRSKIEQIDQIAGGARAQAEEQRRKEEFKVKEKANKIRSTGKLPATCLCF